MYIYNYLTFFAAKIRGYTYTRSQLFQYFWVGMTIFGIITVTTRASRFTSLISRFVISLIVIYINKQQETPFLPSPDQKQADSENNDKY